MARLEDAEAESATTGRVTCRVHLIADPQEQGFSLASIKRFAEAYSTVRHAMELLHSRGTIVTVHGRGTFACKAIED